LGSRQEDDPLTWSNYSFGVGLALGAGVMGIFFLLTHLEARRRIRWFEHKAMFPRGEDWPWEVREPGASDIGSRLPLDRRAP
jgi:hypothetical protein